MDNTKEFEDFDIEVNEVSQSNVEEVPEETHVETVVADEPAECDNATDVDDTDESVVCDNATDTKEPATIEGAEPQPEESAVSNELINMLLERIENLTQQNELLHDKFDAKISDDKHKAQLFDKMYDELASYKKDLYAKLVGPFINETISLLDDYERLVDKIDSIDKERLVKYVKGIPDDLENLLDNNGVERYCDDTEKFNPKTQRVVKTIFTGDIGLDNIIAERIRKGYRWNGVMLKPEMVKIFKFKEGYIEPIKSDNCNLSEFTPPAPETEETTATQE